ncbi:ParA family protein [Streptomyces kronopolitis]|uniref:ParA family protein n=1 Tax=Streptomyces kronopolitis TaxID=1612435 RepID=UPI003D971F59
MADTEVDIVGTLKGGVGKTRLAMMMALYLVTVKKRSVYLIDGDTISQTAYDWMKDAQRAPGVTWPERLTVVRHPFEDIDEHIDTVVKKADHDHVIGDIGGGNRAVFEAALTRAKRLFVPVGADPSETRKLPATWKSARNAAADSTVGGFAGYVVLSRTDHNTSLPREARDQLTVERQAAGREPYPLCDTELVKRVAYQRAYATVPRDFLDVPALLAEVGVIEKESA